jgi:hypothetical protein
MSRTSLVLGLLLSLVIHALLVLPHWDAISASPAVAQARKTEPAVTVVPPPPLPVVEERRPPPPAPQPETAPPNVQFAEVVEPVTTPTEEPVEIGDTELTTETEPDDDRVLPTTRIIWESPQELTKVARALRMSVVAVNRINEVVGALALDGSLRIEPFDGSFDVYSNRVRSLPSSFFGPALQREAGHTIVAYWVLVPESVDREMADVVRQAVRQAGLAMSEVDWVEARFAAQAGGGHRLVVTDIRSLPQRMTRDS